MLTTRQSEVLEFIRAFARKHRIPPSVREIQARFRFSSPNGAQSHVAALLRKGFLVKRGRGARRIEPVDRGAGVPVFGTIPAGSPVEATQEAGESVALDEALFGLTPGTSIYALRVTGDSMTGAGINQGDLVVLTPRPPKSGDIVAALVDGRSTLKRYLHERNGPVLRAENPAYKEIVPADELVIQGVMVGLLRVGTGKIIP